jgi:hypothetical protein
VSFAESQLAKGAFLAGAVGQVKQTIAEQKAKLDYVPPTHSGRLRADA